MNHKEMLLGFIVIGNAFPLYAADTHSESTDSTGISNIASLEPISSSSEASSSAGPKVIDIPGLEPISSTWISESPTVLTQKNNNEKKLLWNYILRLDNAAHNAKNPMRKKLLRRKAQRARNYAELYLGIKEEEAADEDVL